MPWKLSTALRGSLAALALGSSLPAWANSPELQAVVLPASVCELATNGSNGARPTLSTLDHWTLGANGRWTLVCSVPIRDAVPVTSFRIAYRDPDGRLGNASVKAFVIQTGVLADGSFGGDYRCDFVSNFQGTLSTRWTVVEVACPTLPTPADPRLTHIEITVELWRRGTGDSSFAPSFGSLEFP